MNATTRPLTLADLDYELSPELIAQHPAEPRDASRLLVYDRGRTVMSDQIFRDLPGLLAPGDLLVRNDTRVLAARTHFRRATGGLLELLFLTPREAGSWEVLVRGRPRVGETLALDGDEGGWQVRCLERFGDGRWLVHSLNDEPVTALLARHGETPLPP